MDQTGAKMEQTGAKMYSNPEKQKPIRTLSLHQSHENFFNIYCNKLPEVQLYRPGFEDENKRK